MSLELAELLGIIIGDGHVGHYFCEKTNRNYYRINICEHIDDIEHINYTNSLIKHNFNIKFNQHIIKEKNCVELKKKSQAICLFLKRVAKIPNNKKEISIPECIKNTNGQFQSAFLKGLADTDFCLTIKYKPNAYPVIQGGFKSKKLAYDASELLLSLGIKNYVRKESQYYKKRDKVYTTHRVYINGFERVNNFLGIIGFSNKNKTKKYQEIIKQG